MTETRARWKITIELLDASQERPELPVLVKAHDLNLYVGQARLSRHCRSVAFTIDGSDAVVAFLGNVPVPP